MSSFLLPSQVVEKFFVPAEEIVLLVRFQACLEI
jgi:hypothetical protein